MRTTVDQESGERLRILVGSAAANHERIRDTESLSDAYAIYTQDVRAYLERELISDWNDSTVYDMFGGWAIEAVLATLDADDPETILKSFGALSGIAYGAVKANDPRTVGRLAESVGKVAELFDHHDGMVRGNVAQLLMRYKEAADAVRGDGSRQLARAVETEGLPKIKKLVFDISRHVRGDPRYHGGVAGSLVRIVGADEVRKLVAERAEKLLDTPAPFFWVGYDYLESPQQMRDLLGRKLDWSLEYGFSWTGLADGMRSEHDGMEGFVRRQFGRDYARNAEIAVGKNGRQIDVISDQHRIRMSLIKDSSQPCEMVRLEIDDGEEFYYSVREDRHGLRVYYHPSYEPLRESLRKRAIKNGWEPAMKDGHPVVAFGWPVYIEHGRVLHRFADEEYARIRGLLSEADAAGLEEYLGNHQSFRNIAQRPITPERVDPSNWRVSVGEDTPSNPAFILTDMGGSMEMQEDNGGRYSDGAILLNRNPVIQPPDFWGFIAVHEFGEIFSHDIGDILGMYHLMETGRMDEFLRSDPRYPARFEWLYRNFRLSDFDEYLCREKWQLRVDG